MPTQHLIPGLGRIAVANARVACHRYQVRFSDAAWQALHAAGARPQRPLWASTGTKNPEYSDVLYVEDLIGPDVINTMPLKTLRAFADHGEATRTVDAAPGDDERVLADAEKTSVDLGRITAELERDGVRSFCDAYNTLLDCIATRSGAMGTG